MHLGMTIDLARCSGCKTCSMLCKAANNLPNDTLWCKVYTEGGNFEDTARGTYPNNLSLQHFPIACQHCENPACTKVCPVGATWKDEETGIVRQDYDKCVGCRYCMAACPYTGVRSFNWEEPKYYADFRFGDENVPEHQKHTVEKCTFCFQNISENKLPACVENCLTRARKFGDLDDPDSEVSKLIATREYKQLLPENGTNPSVYYLV